ncbi:NAD(P)H-dependent glycerol-3-phosphate dehydrogenase [Nitratireductor basaltis]|uniref:Glycerol-3-phosphate dehydrogenase [NAD(P)+] n=1 Tax=Nitratireductor basaltis TaxID=472175 RepID=A0A084U755_9HYPH|nr:NAD(P)H-dependent glycerol-3-phosphate dehydrogenase [Nitratireductor basaltis]KFB08791.1 Glycerol-3-phosphate dehydrogenase [NAD(P)+] [Nitratireductor basaltis]
MKIAVLGAGAWGTALALNALRAGHKPHLWARDPGLADQIMSGSNNRYLPDIALDEGLTASAEMEAALAQAELVLAVTPAQTLRTVLSNAKQHLSLDIPIVLCAKGIERDSGKLMSQLAREVLPYNPIGALSGPSFATDVAKGLPTAVTVAAVEEPLARDLAHKLSGPHLRCYATDDLTGVELGGALKNVLAIAAGATEGAGLGASAVAAIITRGFVELRRIARSFGAREETLMGLSGLGDLILTCSSAQSRNFAFGLALGRGEDLTGRPLAEGAHTAGIAASIVTRKGFDAPIIESVSDLIEGRVTVQNAMKALLSRPLKNEAG